MVCHPLWHKVFWQPQSMYMILKGSNLHKSKDWLCKILSFNPFHSTRLLLQNSYWLFKFLFVQHYLSNSKINSPLLYQENWEALPWTILVLLGTHTLSITPQTSQILSSPYLSLVSCAKIALLIFINRFWSQFCSYSFLHWNCHKFTNDFYLPNWMDTFQSS